VDWNPAPPDKNMGRGGRVLASERAASQCGIRLSCRKWIRRKTMPPPDVTALLKNAPISRSRDVEGQDREGRVFQEVELAVGESKDVTFDPTIFHN